MREHTIVAGFILGFMVGTAGVGNATAITDMPFVRDPGPERISVGFDDMPFTSIAASPAEARIHAIGYREAAVPYTAAADTLVLPSRAEGLSKVIIEAMACRVPPVVTPAGGGELVRHGIDGLVVPYGARDELSHAIQQMAEDRERRKAMGEAAHRRIETDFSVEETVRKTRALYEELRLARRRPSAEVRSPDRSRTTGE